MTDQTNAAKVYLALMGDEYREREKQDEKECYYRARIREELDRREAKGSFWKTVAFHLRYSWGE